MVLLQKKSDSSSLSFLRLHILQYRTIHHSVYQHQNTFLHGSGLCHAMIFSSWKVTHAAGFVSWAAWATKNNLSQKPIAIHLTKEQANHVQNRTSRRRGLTQGLHGGVEAILTAWAYSQRRRQRKSSHEGSGSARPVCHYHHGFLIQGSRLPILS
jgi:hypothetical protein